MQTDQETMQPEPMIGPLPDAPFNYDPFAPSVQPVKSIKIEKVVYHIENGILFEAKPGAIIPVRGASRSSAALIDDKALFELTAQDAFKFLMSGYASVLEHDRL